jgi:hypothetical protein
MSETKRGGCSVWIILLLLVVPVFCVMIPGLLWMKHSRSASHRAEQEAEAARTRGIAFASSSGDEQESVTISPAQFGRYSPADFGSGLSREHFVALMADDHATELARQTFTRNANGQPIRWLLKTGDVEEEEGNSGALVATFELPYRIQTGHGSWSGSSLSIRAEFGADERERLLMLRRSDWVTVEGRLQLADNRIKLLEARIHPPVEAEKTSR